MANPHKGEASFEASGKTYTLHLSADAICQMEDALDMGIVAISQEMATWGKDAKRIRLKTIRAVIWAALQDRHPDVDLKAAGELILAAGGVAAVVGALEQAFTLAFPPAETKGARPRKEAPQRMAGTGASSSIAG